MTVVQTHDEITKRGPFSPDEDAYILENAGRMSVLAIARQLGRWHASVSKRLKRLRGQLRTPYNVHPPQGAGTFETVSVGDVVGVDRQGADKRRRVGDERPTRGLVVEKHPKFAVVRFYHQEPHRTYCEAFGYEALTVVREAKRRAG